MTIQEHELTTRRRKDLRGIALLMVLAAHSLLFYSSFRQDVVRSLLAGTTLLRNSTTNISNSTDSLTTRILNVSSVVSKVSVVKSTVNISFPEPGTYNRFRYEQVYAYSDTPYELSEDAQKLPTIENRLGLMVHIGKASGTMVSRLAPRTACTADKLPDCEQHVKLLQGDYQETALSKFLPYEMHIFNGRLKGAKWGNVTSLLYTLRNPMTRTISAFNFLHYNSSGISVFAGEQSAPKDRFYLDCFPTVDNLLRTVHEATETIRTALPKNDNANVSNDDIPLSFCQKLAITVLAQSPANGCASQTAKWLQHINIHLKMNYQWYEHLLSTDLVYGVHRLQEKETLVLRTEHLWTDVKDLDKQLGGPGYFAFEGGAVNSNNVVVKSKNATTIIPYMEDLCCVLWAELETYTRILNRAVNLNSLGKRKAMDDLFRTCSIDNPIEWMPTTKNKPNDSASTDFSWKSWYRQSCVPITDFVDRRLMKR